MPYSQKTFYNVHIIKHSNIEFLNFFIVIKHQFSYKSLGTPSCPMKIKVELEFLIFCHSCLYHQTKETLRKKKRKGSAFLFYTVFILRLHVQQDFTPGRKQSLDSLIEPTWVTCPSLKLTVARKILCRDWPNVSHMLRL